MKIIDFERKGNLVRFYLGDDDLLAQCGHHAQRVLFGRFCLCIAPPDHLAGLVFCARIIYGLVCCLWVTHINRHTA